MSEREALEQIAIVCTDNMDRDCDHRMALDFVRQVANDCLARVPAATLPQELEEWKQAASVEAGLRREFLARAEKAEAALASRQLFDMTRTALEAARDYLVEEANSGSVWSSIGSAKALAAIDAALSVTRPDGNTP